MEKANQIKLGGNASKKKQALTKIRDYLHPSLASLGDGLRCSVGSQRDEAKRQAFSPAQDLNPGPEPGRPMVNSWTRLKSDGKDQNSSF